MQEQHTKDERRQQVGEQGTENMQQGSFVNSLLLIGIASEDYS